MPHDGIDASAIEHAVRHAMATVEQDDEVTMLLGADPSGRLIESARSASTGGWPSVATPSWNSTPRSVASDEYDPAVVAVDDTGDLKAVAEAANAVAVAEARLLTAVAVARAHQRSWGRIGIALGVSRQAARQRFADQVGE